MARLYDTSSDYQEHIDYSGEPVVDDNYDADFTYDRAQLSYDGNVIDLETGYASSSITYASNVSGYNGSKTVAKIAYGTGNSSQTATGVRVVVRTTTNSATSAQYVTQFYIAYRQATSTGTGTHAVTQLHKHLRDGSESATGTESSTSVRVVFREATGAGTGTSSVTRIVIHKRQELSSGTGTESTTSLHKHLRNGTGVGTSNSNNAIVHGHIRTAFGAGGATTSDTATGLHKHLRESTGQGQGTSSVVRIIVRLRTGTGQGDGTSTSVSRRIVLRTSTNAGNGQYVVEYHVKRLRIATGTATSSSTTQERLRRMARYTVNNVIDRVRRHLNSSLRHETNVLAVAFGVSDTTLTLTYDLSTSIRPGAILSIGTELCRVTSFNASLKQITVLRGWQDSEIEAHGISTEVLINPRFTRFDIFDSIIDEIASWETEIFKVEDYQWTLNGDTDTVELPSQFEDAIGVCRVSRQWDDPDSTSWPRIKYRLQRGSVSAWDGATSSGLVIRLVFEGNVKRTGKVHALIAMPFDITTTLTGTTNLVSVLGMTPSQVDLLVQGVKVRLLADDENIRSSRQAANVALSINQYNAQSNLDHLQVARANYLRRYNEEIDKIRARYPVKSW